MKKISLLIIFSLLLVLSINAQCPIFGESLNVDKEYSDSLKNRAPKILTPDPSITLEEIIKSGNDVNRFSENKYVSIEGYIVKVKYGGAETCNCHLKYSDDDQDIHIELSLTQKRNSPHIIIAEVTRFTKSDILSYKNIKAMVGRKVMISGYLFFDKEHWQNAVNTNPDGTNLWRQSIVEVHPVCKIVILD